MTAPYIPPRPRTLEEALRAAFMPPIQADATATPPVRPDFSGVPMATMRATSAPMPRGPRESGNPAADRLNARVDRGLAVLGRQAAPSADTPEGWLREMFNPVAAGRGTREMANATMAQARRAGRTGNVSDAAMAAGLGGLTLASAIPGGPADDAARVAAGQSVNPNGVRAVASYYNTKGARELAHRVKQGDMNAVRQMARDMASLVPEDAILVPIPSRTGRATTTKALADEISALTGRPVVDVLQGKARPSLYEMKKSGQGIPDDALSMRVVGDFPSGRVVLVDNVSATGATVRAARQSLPGADAIVHSIDETAVRSPEQARILNATMQSPTPEASAIRNALVPQAPDAPAGIRAYHGTPHRFAPEPGHPLGRLRLDKMGTGEGLQGYGWGGYLADSEEFADQYRQIQGPFSIDGEGWWHARADLSRFSPQEQSALNLLNMAEGDIGEAKAIASEYPAHAPAYAYAERLVADGRVKKSGPGNVYEARIDASPDELLDFDKPLTEQSPSVMAALRNLGLSDDNAIPTTPDAADRMRRAGVPGMSYEIGDGVRNYVIWDESKIRILKALAAAGMVSPAALASAEAAYAQQQQERP